MSPSDDFPPASGTVLDGRFRVERALGSGGMGVVVAAEHLALRRRVAIKLLRPELAGRGDIEARFLREARAIARLKSEHVIDVLDVGTLTTGIPYFVMEYLSGIDLGTLVAKRGPLAVDVVVDYALQTLEALAEAHRQGIIHRDLKPRNLFLTTREDGSGLVKVLDFGVSKLVGWEVTNEGMVTKKGMVLGSPLYMSPEHIRDSSAVDQRTDLWSLGAVMHELLAGQAPFDRGGLGEVIRAVCAEPYRPPARADLPPELAAILACCLAKKRAERFEDAAALARAFQPLVTTAAAQVSVDRIVRSASSVAPPSLGGAARGERPSDGASLKEALLGAASRYEDTPDKTIRDERPPEWAIEREAPPEDTTIPNAKEGAPSPPKESRVGNAVEKARSPRVLVSALVGAGIVAGAVLLALRSSDDGAKDSDSVEKVMPAQAAPASGATDVSSSRAQAPTPEVALAPGGSAADAVKGPEASRPGAAPASSKGVLRGVDAGSPESTPARPSSASPPGKTPRTASTAAFPAALTMKPLGDLPPPPTPTEKAKKRPLDKDNPFGK